MLILAVNSGSSSLKCAAVDPEQGSAPLSALAESLGTESARLRVTRLDASGKTSKQSKDLPGAGHEQAIEAILDLLREDAELWQRLAGVGHRVVHGGEFFTASCLLSDEVLGRIEECSRLAPLHNPANLLGISAARRALPELPHVAVFDTAFHQTMPEAAWHYAVPRSWYEEHGVRRYGFHGTSHRFVAEHAAEHLQRPAGELHLITAHLGNGCSLAAVSAGQCVDTTMGLTPLEGLVMGTRSGDIDPAVVQHMHQRAGMSVDDIFTALNKKSGLLGLSGRSNDMRELLEGAELDPRSRLAIDVFCHRLAKHIGALATNLPRLDALIFTGGIGEHAAPIRRQVVGRLAVLGLAVDESANDTASAQADVASIHAATSSGAILVVPTNEELMIARDTQLLASAAR